MASDNDQLAKNAKKAAEEYADVVNANAGGLDLKALMGAVAAAAQKKADGNKILSKKELKQRLETLRKGAKLHEEKLKLLEVENARIASEQLSEENALRLARIRALRMAAVTAGRAAIDANLQKFKQLVFTLEPMLNLIQRGVVTADKVKAARRLHQSCVDALSALPAKLQFPMDKERLALNLKIIEDLEEIAKQDNEETTEKKKKSNITSTYLTQGQGSGKYGSMGRSFGMAASMVGKLGASIAGLAWTEAKGIGSDLGRVASNTGYNISNSAVTAWFKTTAAIRAIPEKLGELKDKTVPWLKSLFGTMLRSIRGWIGKSLHKAGSSILSNFLPLMGLVSTMIGPILKGINQGIEEMYGEHYMKDFFMKVWNNSIGWLWTSMKNFFGFGASEAKAGATGGGGGAQDKVTQLNSMLATLNSYDHPTGTRRYALIDQATALANTMGDDLPAATITAMQKAGVHSKQTKKLAPSASPAASGSGGTASIATPTGPSMDANPVTALPPGAAASGATGGGGGGGNPTGGAPSVSQVPNQLTDDGLFAYNAQLLEAF